MIRQFEVMSVADPQRSERCFLIYRQEEAQFAGYPVIHAAVLGQAAVEEDVLGMFLVTELQQGVRMS